MFFNVVLRCFKYYALYDSLLFSPRDFVGSHFKLQNGCPSMETAPLGLAGPGAHAASGHWWRPSISGRKLRLELTVT